MARSRSAGRLTTAASRDADASRAAEALPALVQLARLSSDAVETLAEALEAAAAGSLPLLLTSATHAR